MSVEHQRCDGNAIHLVHQDCRLAALAWNQRCEAETQQNGARTVDVQRFLQRVHSGREEQMATSLHLAVHLACRRPWLHDEEVLLDVDFLSFTHRFSGVGKTAALLPQSRAKHFESAFFVYEEERFLADDRSRWDESHIAPFVPVVAISGAIHVSSQLYPLKTIVVLDFAKLTATFVQDAVTIVPLLLVIAARRSFKMAVGSKSTTHPTVSPLGS